MNIGTGLSGVGGTVSHAAPSAPSHPSVGSGVSGVAHSVPPRPFFNAPIRHTGSVGSAVKSAGRAVTHPAPPQARTNVFRQNILGNGLQNRFFVDQQLGALENVAKALSQIPDNARYNQAVGRRNEVSHSAYLSYLGDLWNRAQSYYPAGAQEPQTRFQNPALNLAGQLGYGAPQVPGAAAWVTRGASGPPPGQAPMNVTRATVEGTFSPNPNYANYDRQVPLHEWAHIFQSPSVWRQGRPAVEGGAEAFKQAVAARLGMPRTQAPGYQGFANRMSQRGAPYVMRGQFASPVGP